MRACYDFFAILTYKECFRIGHAVSQVDQNADFPFYVGISFYFFEFVITL